MTKVIVLFTTIGILSGCATYQPDQAMADRAQATVPTCKTDRECEIKWAAAKKWVMTNSAYTLRIVTDDYVETFSATGGSSLISVRVAKEPILAGGYRFVVGVWCDNMFGCNPDSWKSAITFNEYVSAAYKE